MQALPDNGKIMLYEPHHKTAVAMSESIIR